MLAAVVSAAATIWQRTGEADRDIKSQVAAAGKRMKDYLELLTNLGVPITAATVLILAAVSFWLGMGLQNKIDKGELNAARGERDAAKALQQLAEERQNDATEEIAKQAETLGELETKIVELQGALDEAMLRPVKSIINAMRSDINALAMSNNATINILHGTPPIDDDQIPSPTVFSGKPTLAERLQEPGWILNFDPRSPHAKKPISFESDGSIGKGNNEYESTWVVHNNQLVIKQASGKVQNTFDYDLATDQFKSTGLATRLGIAGQFIYREPK